MQHQNIRAIRGATSVSANTPEAIWKATRELLLAVVEANGLAVEDIVSIIFTASRDLNAAFPAAAARQLGWVHVPLLDVQQFEAPDLPRTLRILVHAYTPLRPTEIQHIYLGEAQRLRPDLVKKIETRKQTRILVSGITCWQEALLAIEKGAHALGFVLEPKSHPYVNPEHAREIIQKLPPFVGTVGIFQDTPRYVIQELSTFCRLDYLLFMGDESPKDCHGYVQPVIKKLANLQNYRDYRSVTAFLVPREEIGAAGHDGPYLICPGHSPWERVPGVDGLLVQLEDIL
ncbi:MAG TPA: chorismate mutase [Clostridia bacterium]|nr:chorismate mutase [Clostridia bacterium]